MEEDKKSDIKEDLNNLLNQDVDFDPEIAEIFNELDQNSDFDKEIEQILSNYNDTAADFTKLQNQIINLIKKYSLKARRNNLGKDLKIDENILTQHISEIKNYLSHLRSELSAEAQQSLTRSQNIYRGISKQSLNDFKRAMKRFATYQIYKMLNPKRVAGETRIDNFVHNMIVGGLGRATHYAGGTKQEISHYSPALIKKLTKLNKSGGRGV